MHGSECWCFRKEDERQIVKAEMTWLSRSLRVTKRDKMRNETMRGILCQETTMAEPRLNWFGHVSRMGSERAASKSITLLYQWEKKPRKTTKEMNGQSK